MSDELTIDARWWGMQKTGDADARLYHSRLRFIDHAREAVTQGIKSFEDAYGDVREPCPVARLILDVRGVEFVDLSANRMLIRKSPLVSWAEIERDVMPLLYGVRQAVELPLYYVHEDGTVVERSCSREDAFVVGSEREEKDAGRAAKPPGSRDIEQGE